MNRHSVFDIEQQDRKSVDPPQLPPDWANLVASSEESDRAPGDIARFLRRYEPASLCPTAERVFHAFHRVKVDDVRVVLLGEEPYPRRTSACGIAFWDRELESWQTKVRGNCLHNILKALMIASGLATYQTPLHEVRQRYAGHVFEPDKLFPYWMECGVLLLNASLTFTSPNERRHHQQFWHPWVVDLVDRLNRRVRPWFVAWGRKANDLVSRAHVPADRIIAAGHPTYLHQFCNPSEPGYSPFTEIEFRTGFSWSGRFD